MMIRHRGGFVAIALSLLCASACSSPPPPPAADAPDAALKKVLTSYVVEFLRRNPTTNTYLGGAGLDPSLREVDGMLRDYSATALDDEDRWLGDTQAALEKIEAGGLAAASRIDREVALAQIRFMLRQHQVRHYEQRALDTYVSEPFRALDWQLQGMTATGGNLLGTSDEWTLVVDRVRSVPRFLATAQAQIELGLKSGHVPDPRMLERDGLESSDANAKYFGETLVKMAEHVASGPDKERMLVELRDASRLAAEAYTEFHRFVATTFFDSVKPVKLKTAFAADRFAMGEADYDWATKNNFRIDKTAAQLYDEAWPIVQKTQQQMIELARSIGQQHATWKLPADGPSAVRAVFDQLSKDFPKSDEEMIDWYRQTAFRLVEYGRKTGMFDVPADYKLDVTVTPPPLEASVDGASYYTAPPFKNNGVGRFYVTPTHNDKAALAANNRAALADLAAHEGFPGHDWNFKVMAQARDRISPVRWLTPGAVEDSSSMWEDSMPGEGWGLYAESLMAEPGPDAPNGFYTPEERLYQLQGELYRDLRVRIDSGIHTGRMSYDEAVNLFSEVVDFLPGNCAAAGRKASEAKRASCESAERAIFRYSKWPTQAITYRLGKDQIYAMREEAQKALGDKFSAKAFHLLFMQQGTIPAGYFHDSLMESMKGGN